MTTMPMTKAEYNLFMNNNPKTGDLLQWTPLPLDLTKMIVDYLPIKDKYPFDGEPRTECMDALAFELPELPDCEEFYDNIHSEWCLERNDKGVVEANLLIGSNSMVRLNRDSEHFTWALKRNRIYTRSVARKSNFNKRSRITKAKPLFEAIRKRVKHRKLAQMIVRQTKYFDVYFSAIK